MFGKKRVFKPRFMMGLTLALGSLLMVTPKSVASSQYRITVQNLFTNSEGVFFNGPAFAFHDSSYNLFQVGQQASLGIQSVPNLVVLESML